LEIRRKETCRGAITGARSKRGQAAGTQRKINEPFEPAKKTTKGNSTGKAGDRNLKNTAKPAGGLLFGQNCNQLFSNLTMTRR